MNDIRARGILRNVGFAFLGLCLFRSVLHLPSSFEIFFSGAASFSFLGVFLLYWRSKQQTDRVSRSTFWTFLGSFFAVASLFVSIDDLRSGWTEEHQVAVLLGQILLFIPLIVAGVIIQIRRWHDRDRSGLWILLNLIPYLGTAWSLIECGFIRGTKGPNRFGPDPLATSFLSAKPPVQG